MDLSKFNKVNLNKDSSKLKLFLWYFTNAVLFSSPFFPFYKLKSAVLRMYGAKIGCELCIKPNVSIKYPWKLTVGDYVSIGEGVWIDNLAKVSFGSHSCISQGSYICTGNHDYKSDSFDLILGEVTVGRGCWIGAKALVLPNSVLENGAILTAGSVASGVLQSNSIYQGHPAKKIRDRT